LGIPVYETATGWKYFCNLLDAGLISLCGEESYGTGGNHIREKDGLWAVLCWLNILAATRLTIPQLLERHWRQYGRDLFQRHDYEGLDPAVADALMDHLRQRLASLPGSSCGMLTVERASEFRYRDPVDGSTSTPQGIEVHFRQGGRAVFRLSGTGTQGATLRLYLERPLSPQDALGDCDLTPWVEAARRVADLAGHLGRSEADVVV
jgi:phosphoglucomutase